MLTSSQLYIERLKLEEKNGLLTEKKFQRSVIDILNLEGILVFHINNNSSDKKSGRFNKLQGVKAGVFDLIIIHNNKTVYIELKTIKGKLSNKQKEFIDILEKNHQEYKIIKGVTDFEEFLTYSITI